MEPKILHAFLCTASVSRAGEDIEIPNGGGVCLAIAVDHGDPDQMADETSYRIGISWCKPPDVYNRKRARERAVGRLNTWERYTPNQTRRCYGEESYEACIEKVLSADNRPKWLTFRQGQKLRKILLRCVGIFDKNDKALAAGEAPIAEEEIPF